MTALTLGSTIAKMRNTIVATIVLALIAGFAGGFAVARQRYVPLLEQNSKLIISKDSELKTLKEQDAQIEDVQSNDAFTTYFLEDGKLMVDDGASISAVTKEASISGGTRIMVNGTIVKQNGNRIILSPGEFFGVR